ncbi:unnamed protein product, partial [Rotaria sp. Silwood1]
MSAEQTSEICVNAHKLNLPVHIDGARIFNAATALNQSVAEITKDANSVQFCLSKGLGAPVGSILLGKKEFISEARSWRKRFGGGMRQVGILAAAVLFAPQNSAFAQSANPSIENLSGEKIVEKVSPSVVMILTGTGAGILDKLGSGVIVGNNGVILTAYHVVKDATQVQ